MRITPPKIAPLKVLSIGPAVIETIADDRGRVLHDVGGRGASMAIAAKNENTDVTLLTVVTPSGMDHMMIHQLQGAGVRVMADVRTDISQGAGCTVVQNGKVVHSVETHAMTDHIFRRASLERAYERGADLVLMAGGVAPETRTAIGREAGPGGSVKHMALVLAGSDAKLLPDEHPFCLFVDLPAVKALVPQAETPEEALKILAKRTSGEIVLAQGDHVLFVSGGILGRLTLSVDGLINRHGTLEAMAAGVAVRRCEGFDLSSSIALTANNEVRAVRMAMGQAPAVSRQTLTHTVDETVIRATTDPLTGLASRGEFLRSVENAIHHATPGDTSAWHMLYVDVNRFKQVNDTYGHAAGDEVLARVATLLKDSVREEDVVGRLGGDEFACLVHCPPHEVSRIIRRIAEKERSDVTSLRGAGLAIGHAAWNGRETIAEWIGRADHSMYVKKENSRRDPRAVVAH